MKHILVLALMFVSSAAFAHWDGNDKANGPTNVHVYSAGLTCADVQDAVMDNGAVILHYGEDLYERVVSGDSYCPTGTYTKNFWAPAADGACFSGYQCTPMSDGGN